MANILVKSLKKTIPRRLHPLIGFLKLRAIFVGNDFSNFFRLRKSIPPLPPAVLRYRVHGDVDLDRFVNVGRQCAADLETQLDSVNVKLGEIGNILDWGCGCSRVLRHIKSVSPNQKLFGCDINQDLVSWSSKNIRRAQFRKVGFEPPTPYQDSFFHFIYGISIMTHLDEGYQYLWLKELNRISAPGAIVMLSIHGKHTFDELSADEKKRLQEKGIFYKILTTGAFKLDGLPDFYQTTFHTKEYIDANWSKYFQILKYVERGINHHQDLLVMRKTA